MREGAREQVVAGEDVSASGADAEALGYGLRTRAKEFGELPEGPLFFGRLDFGTSRAAGDHAGQSYHVGRLRVSEEPAAPPLVVDWRAPVARAFYQASPQTSAPAAGEGTFGVAVRRRFGWAPGSRGASADLTGYEDEKLEVPEVSPNAFISNVVEGAEPLRASAVLTAEIERPRTGPMRDIAATIQPEQDLLVRAPLDTSVCVQGAPGTGKTAVGLHRAAYLLYSHPRRLRRSGLLVLGPNPAFLRYIAEVLPALGESGVRQSTVREEIGGPPVRGTDSAQAQAVKHDARMAPLLRRALYARVGGTGADAETGEAGGGGPEGAGAEGAGAEVGTGAVAEVPPLVVPDGSYRWRVPGAELDALLRAVRAEGPPYLVGRERVRSRVVAAVRSRAERRSGPRTAAWERRTGRCRPVAAYLDSVWPRVRPQEVVSALLAEPGRYAEGLLTEAEQRAITRRRTAWSAADLLLLDEVAGLMEHPATYGHIVVDEAQDLSPMECRAIARRLGQGSLTVLGDLAQGTTPWAARDWPALLAGLGRPDTVVTELTTGYRVPAEVLELAGRLLPQLGVDLTPARSLRAGGELTLTRAPDPYAAETVAPAVRRALAHEGAVAVIAADHAVDRLRAVLTGAGLSPSAPEDDPPSRLVLLPVSLAKGLEYDHVVVVDPDGVRAAEERGGHRLYVALTRAVSGLEIVHAGPSPLGAGGAVVR
ncbi:ATP-binding domain-containing protein [Streptomyces sp. NPDC049954]|uniref:HelD family protein n=1 Tax=Streptomyces sp. NPDC049954 TaxID=3155779 RepID=UPI0034190726